MSKYTVELRYIVENEKVNPPLSGQLSLKNILQSYPIWSENYKNPVTNEIQNRRNELNEKILNRYYFREIAFETVEMFLFKLNAKLKEIMPLYNQRYQSVDFEFNPLWNVDMSETYEHTVSGTGKTTSNTQTTTNGSSTSNSNSNSDDLIVNSDTPNQELSENDIKSNKYASSTNYNKGGTNATNNSTLSNTDNGTGEVNSVDSKTESFTRREFGSSKGYTFAQNIDQWRNIMLNIDLEIVEELDMLFMHLW